MITEGGRHLQNQLPAHLSRVFEPFTPRPWCSQTYTDIWCGYTGRQKTVYQRVKRVESKFDMEIVTFIW